MQLESLKKQLSQIDNLIRLLESIKLHPKITRLSKYRKILAEYIKAVEKGTNKELEESPEYESYTKGFYEIAGMIEIYEGIEDLELNENITERLNQILSGPINIDDENPDKSNNTARDIAYELLIGSRLRRAGYQVIYSNESDLEIKEGEQDIFIECKRPSSEKRVVDNIKKAKTQLEKRYALNQNSRGIVALSISKLINKSHDVLHVPDYKSVKQELQSRVDLYIRSNIATWELNGDGKTFGLIVLGELPCYIENENRFLIGTFMAVIGLMPETNSEFKFFTTLHQRLSTFLDPEIVI